MSGSTQQRGLFAGVAGIDIIYRMDDELPRKNGKKTVREFEVQIGGPAAKAAMTCAVLGGKASLLTCIGDSMQGRWLKQELAGMGIETIDLARDQYASPNISAVFLDQAGGTRTVVSGQHPLDGIQWNGVSEEGYDYCLYDCNLPVLTPEIVSTLAECGIPLILDCGSWKQSIEPALSYAEIAISSKVFRSPEGDDIFDLQKKYEIPCAARTNEGDPVEYSFPGEAGTIEVVSLKKGFTIGAGDVFHGAFCYYHRYLGQPIPEALRNAAKCATGYVRDGKIKGEKDEF